MESDTEKILHKWGCRMKKLLKFEREGCVPCQMMANFMDGEGIEYEAVNVYENPALTQRYGIMSVPVVIVLEGEHEVGRVIGHQPSKLMDILGEA